MAWQVLFRVSETLFPFQNNKITDFYRNFIIQILLNDNVLKMDWGMHLVPK